MATKLCLTAYNTSAVFNCNIINKWHLTVMLQTNKSI